MSRYVAKFLKSPLVLASAALVIHFSAATAADSKGDIQQQMKEILTGGATTHLVPQSAPAEGKVTARAVDSQELVKQLLLGALAYRVGGPETGKTEARRRPVASVDMQAEVRQLLLGQPHASDGSPLTARVPATPRT